MLLHDAKKKHIDKTVAAFMSTVLGGLGLHRFYMYGKGDFWGWLYTSAFLVYAGLVLTEYPAKPFGNILFALFPLSVYAAFIESLTIGLTSDEKWDTKHNRHTGISSASKWPLVVVLVLTLLIGYTALVTSIARASDLLYTGGAFG